MGQHSKSDIHGCLGVCFLKSLTSAQLESQDLRTCRFGKQLITKQWKHREPITIFHASSQTDENQAVKMKNWRLNLKSRGVKMKNGRSLWACPVLNCLTQTRKQPGFAQRDCCWPSAAILAAILSNFRFDLWHYSPEMKDVAETGESPRFVMQARAKEITMPVKE